MNWSGHAVYFHGFVFSCQLSSRCLIFCYSVFCSASAGLGCMLKSAWPHYHALRAGSDSCLEAHASGEFLAFCSCSYAAVLSSVH
jgi:hypothetical protein